MPRGYGMGSGRGGGGQGRGAGGGGCGRMGGPSAAGPGGSVCLSQLWRESTTRAGATMPADGLPEVRRENDASLGPREWR